METVSSLQYFCCVDAAWLLVLMIGFCMSLLRQVARGQLTSSQAASQVQQCNTSLGLFYCGFLTLTLCALHTVAEKLGEEPHLGLEGRLVHTLCDP